MHHGGIFQKNFDYTHRLGLDSSENQSKCKKSCKKNGWFTLTTIPNEQNKLVVVIVVVVVVVLDICTHFSISIKELCSMLEMLLYASLRYWWKESYRKKWRKNLLTCRCIFSIVIKISYINITSIQAAKGLWRMGPWRAYIFMAVVVQ